jgi:hypothetical protein
MVFVLMKGIVNGRIDLLPVIISSDLSVYETVLDYFKDIDLRTFEKVLLDPIMYFFGISITLGHILFINRVVGVLILLAAFFIGKTFFKSNLLAILVTIFFASSRFVQNNLTSMEYGTFALLFALSAIGFILSYLENSKKDHLYLGIISFLIAGYFRYELIVILGAPILFFICLFMNRRDLSGKILGLLSLFMVFAAAPILVTIGHGSDPFIHDKVIEGNSVLSLIKNASHILQYNVIDQRDLDLEMGNISFFTYIALLAAPFVIFFGFYNKIKKIELKPLHKKLIFISLLFICMFSFLIFIHKEGMRSGEKYSVNFYILEILLSFGLLYILSENVTIIVGLAAFIWVFNGTSNFFVTSPRLYQSHFYDQYLLLKNIELDPNCTLIKFNSNTPVIDHFFPNRLKSAEFETIVELEKFANQAKCAYLFESPYYSPKPDVLDSNKVDPVFEKCKRDVIFEIEKSYTFIKYSCG